MAVAVEQQRSLQRSCGTYHSSNRNPQQRWHLQGGKREHGIFELLNQPGSGQQHDLAQLFSVVNHALKLVDFTFNQLFALRNLHGQLGNGQLQRDSAERYHYGREQSFEQQHDGFYQFVFKRHHQQQP